MINSRRGSAGAMCWAVTAPVPSSKGESESGYSVTHCLSVSKFIMRACEPYLPSQPTEGWYTAGKVIPKTGLSEHKKKPAPCVSFRYPETTLLEGPIRRLFLSWCVSVIVNKNYKFQFAHEKKIYFLHNVIYINSNFAKYIFITIISTNNLWDVNTEAFTFSIICRIEWFL